MHEWGLVRAAVAALAEASRGRPLAGVVVQTGTGVDPAVAAAAWADTVEGSTVAGAAVRWEPAQDTLACLTCGAGYRGDALTTCSVCGGDGLVVESAPEIGIVEWTERSFVD